MKKRILILDDNEMILGLLHYQLQKDYEVVLSKTLTHAFQLFENGIIPDLLITDLYLEKEEATDFIKNIRHRFSALPIIVLSGEEKSEKRIACLRLGIADYLQKPFHPEELHLRIQNVLKNRVVSKSKTKAMTQPTETNEETMPKPKMSARKRLFDITFAGLALLALLPVMLVVALLIKLDSKGPVFYFSKRVGGGFRVFDLYKFRTMKVGADKKLSQMNHLNQYNRTAKKAEKSMAEASQTLFYDGGWISELQVKQKQENEAAFLKFQNDPRITRIGNFLRNTSLDELPQLLNILKGDMSIVGNRPLPLYEAEKLTKDESAARFLAPAGLTGLWQVTKRGKGDLSAAERVWLDNQYAFRHNWHMDLKLIAKTFPALFQIENQ